MKCPNCTEELDFVGYNCSGHNIYQCPECDKEWEIKEVEEDRW